MNSYAPVIISSLALLFTVFSFWWMNWRPGKLRLGNIRFFAAGKGTQGVSDWKNLVIVTLPLLLSNSGARPVVLENIRLRSCGAPATPDLSFEGVDDRLFKSPTDPSINRDYFLLPTVVKANEVLKGNFVFQCVPEKEFRFQRMRYVFHLEARLANSDRWRKLGQIELDFSSLNNIELFSLNEMYDVFPYRSGSNT